MRINFF